MPRFFVYIAIIAVCASLVPFAIIARSRQVKSDRTKIRLQMNMSSQEKYKPQSENPLFADRRAMRPVVPGTVARSTAFDLLEDDRVALGREPDGAFVARIPLPITRPMVERGRERFNIYCAPCHGLSGYGDGLVSRRADQLQEGTWVPPLSFHGDQVRQRPDGHIYNTIANGIRNMPAYGTQISVEDRWAIVAYIRALERSQNATAQDVPPELRSALR